MEGGTPSIFLRGSFATTSPEALVDLPGCEGHVLNYAGLVLTREVQGGWVPISYLPGFSRADCDARLEPSGLSRLACLELRGLNSGTYEQIASVLDFRQPRPEWLLSSQCEEGYDIDAVTWSGALPPTVEVRVTYGAQRDNDGDHCFEMSGPQRRLALRYEQTPVGFRPDNNALADLLRLLPPVSAEQRLDPAVAAATGFQQKVPAELLPRPGESSFVDLRCQTR
jgi:hypothetical protein